MSKFFAHYFEEGDFSKTEVSVRCPYPHKTSSGTEYYESNPSAGVNVDKDVFHCMRCGASKSEVGFIADVLGCSYENASKIHRVFEDSSDNLFTWRKQELTEHVEEKALALGITPEVISLLQIKTTDYESISFPVFMYGKIMDVRNYNPEKRPKVMSRTGAISGLIIPFDIWRKEPKDKWTIVCAGEKDMAIARSLGFKAITITGGEGALPLIKSEFKDRKVAIMYDNDDAGILGAKKLAAVLKPYASQVKLVTNFHEICNEKGEDLTDLVMKYGMGADYIKQCIANTPDFTDEEAEEIVELMFPTVSLFEAAKPKNINKTVRSNIQVVATFEQTFTIPTSVKAVKTKVPEETDKAKLHYGEERHWNLSEKNVGDILHLMDNNFKEDQIFQNLLGLLNIPKKEKDIKVSKSTKETIFKCSVTDLFESTTEKAMQMEYTAYSIGKKLESGKKYRATYSVVPHPYQGQQLIMIITDVEEAADTVSTFEINKEAIESLQKFQSIEGKVSDKVDTIVSKVQGITGFPTDKTLIQAIDFSYHTVLEFNFGKRFQKVRGYLDTLVVTESRVGKSTTALALQKTYGLGTFASLAGSSATKAGLIGGANKVNGAYQTRAGLIPQNHRGLVIFEELAKCNSDIIKELTDIRSSNEVRIVRVNGALYLPALVRMITLTNVKSAGQITKPISSYPNGIEVVVELIGTAEDIARYDMMLVLGNPGNRNMDFNWVPDTPFDDKDYQTRIRWVWSRTAEQVILTDEVLEHIVDKCNHLNDQYDSHIKIFGTEAWKKVTRLAIAVAGYTVSTDETYENIVVTKEHVDYAVDYMTKLYDNDTFRLKEYVSKQRKMSEIDDEGVQSLQDLYIGSPSLLIQLEESSYSSRNELMAATGQTNDDFNVVMNNLIRGNFVQYKGQAIMPTERFRKGMRLINKTDTYVPKLGEIGEL